MEKTFWRYPVCVQTAVIMGSPTIGMRAGAINAHGDIYNYVSAPSVTPVCAIIVFPVTIGVILSAVYLISFIPACDRQPSRRAHWPICGQKRSPGRDHRGTTKLQQLTTLERPHGGMGKTELARKFAYDHRKDYFIAWIDAETEESTQRSIKAIARSLELTLSPEMNGTEIADRVFQSNRQRSSLIVYDNANQLKTAGGKFGIFYYLPRKTYRNPPLDLVTSQTKDWAKECKTIEVEELSQEDSLEFRNSVSLSAF